MFESPSFWDQPSPYELAVTQNLARMDTVQELRRRKTDSDMWEASSNSQEPLLVPSRARSSTCSEVSISSRRFSWEVADALPTESRISGNSHPESPQNTTTITPIPSPSYTAQCSGMPAIPSYPILKPSFQKFRVSCRAPVCLSPTLFHEPRAVELTKFPDALETDHKSLKETVDAHYDQSQSQKPPHAVLPKRVYEPGQKPHQDAIKAERPAHLTSHPGTMPNMCVPPVIRRSFLWRVVDPVEQLNLAQLSAYQNALREWWFKIDDVHCVLVPKAKREREFRQLLSSQVSAEGQTELDRRGVELETGAVSEDLTKYARSKAARELLAEWEENPLPDLVELMAQADLIDKTEGFAR